MSAPRFYCEELRKGLVTLDESETRHARSSLRLSAGDEAEIIDGAGGVARGVVVTGDDTGKRKKRGGLCFEVGEVRREPRPVSELTLITAASKGPRLTWMIEKTTELGATGILIADFERSVVHAGETRAEKLRRTSMEAVKQSRRLWAPRIEAGLTLDEALEAECASGASVLLIAHPDEDAAGLAECLSRDVGAGGRITAVVGPEGGLTEEEVKKLREANGEVVRLARHILRIETAAVSVAAAWAARYA